MLTTSNYSLKPLLLLHLPFLIGCTSSSHFAHQRQYHRHSRSCNYFTNYYKSFEFFFARYKLTAKSLVVGRPILLGHEDIDGSPSFIEKALRFLAKCDAETVEILLLLPMIFFLKKSWSWNSAANDNDLRELYYTYTIFFERSKKRNKMQWGGRGGSVSEDEDHMFLEENLISPINIDWKHTFKRAYKGMQYKGFAYKYMKDSLAIASFSEETPTMCQPLLLTTYNSKISVFQFLLNGSKLLDLYSRLP